MKENIKLEQMNIPKKLGGLSKKNVEAVFDEVNIFLDENYDQPLMKMSKKVDDMEAHIKELEEELEKVLSDCSDAKDKQAELKDENEFSRKALSKAIKSHERLEALELEVDGLKKDFEKYKLKYEDAIKIKVAEEKDKLREATEEIYKKKKEEFYVETKKLSEKIRREAVFSKFFSS